MTTPPETNSLEPPPIVVGTTTPIAPPDDGSFDHPGLQGFPQYDVNAMAKQLYEDAGISYPGLNTPPAPPPTTPPVSTLTPEIPPPPEPVKIRDRELSAEQANAMLDWHDYLSSHPNEARQIVDLIQGRQLPEPPTTQQPEPQAQPTFTPPPDFDVEDPANKFILDQFGNVNSRLQQMQEAQLQSQMRQAQEQARRDMDMGLTAFKNLHPSFTNEDIDAIRRTTGQLNITGGLVESSRTPTEGIVRALEIGMYQNETTRNKAIAELGQPVPPQAPTQDAVRQAKLNAIGGAASGAVPRTDPPPRLDSDQAMRQELEKAFTPYFANR